MDRRTRKTREAIFKAFTDLLSLKGFDGITVSEIIEKADVGRATFYAHFETKDFLLKELCEELFCHIFDQAENFGTDALMGCVAHTECLTVGKCSLVPIANGVATIVSV